MCVDSHGASLSEKARRRDARAFWGTRQPHLLAAGDAGERTPGKTLKVLWRKDEKAEGMILRGYLGARHDFSACFPGPKPVQAEGLLKYKLEECEHTACAETRLLRRKMLVRGNHFSKCGQVTFEVGGNNVCAGEIYMLPHYAHRRCFLRLERCSIASTCLSRVPASRQNDRIVHVISAFSLRSDDRESAAIFKSDRSFTRRTPRTPARTAKPMVRRRRGYTDIARATRGFAARGARSHLKPQNCRRFLAISMRSDSKRSSRF
jgi:hypothetical protein